MQMINLYLAEIEKHLPARNREDVLKETIGIELPKPMMLDMNTSTLTGGAGV